MGSSVNELHDYRRLWRLLGCKAAKQVIKCRLIKASVAIKSKKVCEEREMP